MEAKKTWVRNMERNLISKEELRREVLLRRDAMSEMERKKASLLLTERLLGHQWFYRSDVILGFVNYGSEIATTEILEEALMAGKKVYVPKIVECVKSECETGIPSESEMKFYRINSMADLKIGYKGIPEPDGAGEEFQYKESLAEKTLMIMPGVAFDMFRNRIGYGKGFYDRYLADKEALQFRTIGVGFKGQMVEEIPAEENDIRPYQVIVV